MASRPTRASIHEGRSSANATGADTRTSEHARFRRRRHITHASALNGQTCKGALARARGARERFACTGGHHVAEFQATGMKTVAEPMTTLFALDVFVPPPRKNLTRGDHPGGTSQFESDSSAGRPRKRPASMVRCCDTRACA